MPSNKGSAKQRKRIAFVLPSFEIGGSQRVLLTIMSNIDRNAFASELIVFDGEGGLADIVPDDITVHILHRRRLRNALLALAQKLRERRPAVVVSTLGYVNLALLAMRPALTGNPRIIVRESNLPSQSLQHLKFARLLILGYRYLYPSADLVICQSNRMGGELADHFHVQEDRIVHLPNPVDTASLRASASKPIRTPGTGLRLVAGGHLIPQKGYDLLLDMFAELPSDAHLTILGDGPERAALEKRGKELGLSKRLSMPGFHKSPWALYAGADAMMLPSRWEGMPNAALEAIACGTPVIGTPHAGGLTEVADLAPPGSVVLAHPGNQFVQAIKAITPRQTLALRDSLLPRRFELKTVVDQFNGLLSNWDEMPTAKPVADRL